MSSGLTSEPSAWALTLLRPALTLSDSPLCSTVVYQSTQYDPDTISLRLGGTMALLKAQSTEMLEYCAREAMQIFGGLAYTKGGQGEKVERLYRDAKAYSIPGGSFEIMQDLGIRQSVKVAQIMGAKL